MFEIPLVCPHCDLVHRVRSSSLTAQTVTCPHCGHDRDAATLRASFPRELHGIEPHAHVAKLSEFPLRG